MAQTTVDLFAFGSKAGPRSPRAKDLLADANGMVRPGSASSMVGASTFGDIAHCALSGHYHVLPAGSQLPDELGVVADGKDIDLDNEHPKSHHTIYATQSISVERFVELFLNLPWEYAGKKHERN